MEPVQMADRRRKRRSELGGSWAAGMGHQSNWSWPGEWEIGSACCYYIKNSNMVAIILAVCIFLHLRRQIAAKDFLSNWYELITNVTWKIFGHIRWYGHHFHRIGLYIWDSSVTLGTEITIAHSSLAKRWMMRFFHHYFEFELVHITI